MILGMSLATVTQIHVIFSLIGIVSGSGVVLAILAGKRTPKSTHISTAAVDQIAMTLTIALRA